MRPRVRLLVVETRLYFRSILLRFDASILLGDGRAFYVKHRDEVSRSPSGRIMIVHGDDDRFNILDMLLITELEVHAQANPEAAG